MPNPVATFGLALILAVSGLAYAAAHAPATAQNVQNISAIVNDEIVSAFDVEQRLQLVIASTEVPDARAVRSRLTRQVLRSLVDEKLQIQEARRLNISLTSQEIDRAIAMLAERNKVSVESLPRMLASRNIKIGALLNRLRAEIVWTKLIARRFGRLIQIGEDEVDEVIARLNANRGKLEHQFSEIFLAVAKPEEDEEVRKNAQRLAEEARRGAPFAAIARQFSQSATASIGGDVGWTQPGQISAEIEKALNAMKVGDVSDPIRAQGGYYVIKLRDRGRILMDDPDDATVSLMQILLPRQAAGGEEYLAKQRELAARIAQSVKGCEAFASAAKKLGTPGSGDLGTLRLGDLPADIRETAAKIEIGQPSQPIERSTGIHVFMVCERSAKRSSALDRDQIRTQIRQQRLTMMARRYLRDLRRDATIEYR